MKRIVKWILNTLIITVFLSYSILAFNAWQERANTKYVPGLGKYKLISVLSDSMKPVMQAGDVIVVDNRPKVRLAKGDVVTYWHSGSNSLLTHRIIAATEQDGQQLYYTQGDANNVMDGSPVLECHLVGKYLFCIPKGGVFISYLHTRIGFLLLIMLPILAALVLEVRQLYPGVRDQLRRKQSAEVKQTEA